MVEEGQYYKCNICGNKVKVVEAGGGELTCCDAKMQLVSEGPEKE
jgi:superoxide reductase